MQYLHINTDTETHRVHRCAPCSYYLLPDTQKYNFHFLFYLFMHFSFSVSLSAKVHSGGGFSQKFMSTKIALIKHKSSITNAMRTKKKQKINMLHTRTPAHMHTNKHIYEKLSDIGQTARRSTPQFDIELYTHTHTHSSPTMYLAYWRLRSRFNATKAWTKNAPIFRHNFQRVRTNNELLLYFLFCSWDFLLRFFSLCFSLCHCCATLATIARKKDKRHF